MPFDGQIVEGLGHLAYNSLAAVKRETERTIAQGTLIIVLSIKIRIIVIIENNLAFLERWHG